MAFLIDIIALCLAAATTGILYLIYYFIFIKGYVKRIRKAIENGEISKARRMEKIAFSRQYYRMSKLLKNDSEKLK